MTNNGFGIEVGTFDPKTPDETRDFYRSESGDDSRNGFTMSDAVQSPQLAIDKADGLVRDPDSKPSVISDSSDTVATQLTIYDNINVDFRNMNITNQVSGDLVTVGTNSKLEIEILSKEFSGASERALYIENDATKVVARSIENQDGVGVEISGSSGLGVLQTDFLRGNNAFVDSRTSGDTYFFSVERVLASNPNESIIINNGSALTKLDVDQLDSNGNPGNVGVEITGSGGIYGEVDLAGVDVFVRNNGTGNGTISLRGNEFIGSVECNSALTELRYTVGNGDITVAAGATADIFILQYDHSLWTVTNNGTLNGIIGGVKYGTYASSGDIIIQNWQEAIDNLAPADPSSAYKIKGTIVATDDTSLDLNGATVSGVDGRSKDGFLSTQPNHKLLVTSQGASVSGLSFTVNGAGSEVFDISGATGSEAWSVQYCSFVGNTNIGTIDNVIFQEINNTYQGNAAGITLNDISSYFDLACTWVQNNTALTYKTFTGNSNLIKITGGGMEVVAGSTGYDISGLTLNDFGSIDGGYNFTGAGTFVDNVAIFEDPVWFVEASGIDKIYKDQYASGSYYLNSPTSTTVSVNDGDAGNPKKAAGATTSQELFRFDMDANNRLTYLGNHTITKKVRVDSGLDNVGFGSAIISGYIAKNGTPVPGSRSPSDSGGFFVGIQNVGPAATVEFSNGDYVEFFLENQTSLANIDTETYILTVN